MCPLCEFQQLEIISACFDVLCAFKVNITGVIANYRRKTWEVYNLNTPEHLCSVVPQQVAAPLPCFGKLYLIAHTC